MLLLPGERIPELVAASETATKSTSDSLEQRERNESPKESDLAKVTGQGEERLQVVKVPYPCSSLMAHTSRTSWKGFHEVTAQRCVTSLRTPLCHVILAERLGAEEEGPQLSSHGGSRPSWR